MILAVIAIVPLLLERIHNEEFDRNERIQAAYKQALDVARQGAAEQNEVIASARAILQVIATARATFDASNNECNRFLATIAKPVPWIKALSVANLQGRIICSSESVSLDLDVSERPHFRKAVATDEFVLSDYYVGTRIKTPLITLPSPSADRITPPPRSSSACSNSAGSSTSPRPLFRRPVVC